MPNDLFSSPHQSNRDAAPAEGAVDLPGAEAGDAAPDVLKGGNGVKYFFKRRIAKKVLIHFRDFAAPITSTGCMSRAQHAAATAAPAAISQKHDDGTYHRS